MITCPNCKQASSTDSIFCTECGKPLGARDTLGGLETPMPGTTRHGAIGLPARPSLVAGEVFAGRYTIVEKLGQGGMGEVYRAKEKIGSVERELALKLIRADRLGDPQAVDRLVNEGVLTQDIRHPNVVGVYNVGVEGTQPFVAMEFVDGASLREWIRRQMNMQKDTALPVAAAIIRSILEGLDAAHRKGVIHRDLKPENIIITGEPTGESAPLKVLDFGIARAPGTQHTTGSAMLTPEYGAPEQRTNADGVMASADLYSLSKIFYELLMGVFPDGHWQPPSGGRGDVPEAIDKLIQAGLSSRPQSRPQSVEDYRARLDRAMGMPVKQKPQQPVSPVNTLFGGGTDRAPPVETSKKSIWVAAGAGAVGLLVVIGILSGGGGDDVLQLREPLYTDYAGTWTGDTGTVINLLVDGAGNATGKTASGSFASDISGELQNNFLNFDALGAQAAVQYESLWCHVVLNVTDPSNGSQISERFHVNHQAGQDCPILYAE